MRRFGLTILVVAFGLLALPAMTSARSGWKLPKAKSEHGKRAFTSVAWTCGSSKFGDYRFMNGARRKGRWRGAVVFRVRLTPDERVHKPRFGRFVGNLPRRLRKRTRRVLSRTRFWYNTGPPAKVDSLFTPRSLQASRPFNPIRVSRAQC